MAVFTDMAKLLFLFMVAATWSRAQSQQIDAVLPEDIAPTPLPPLSILISGAPGSCPLVVPPEDCPTLALANNYRASVDDDSIKFRTRFGSVGKGSTGLKQATVVINPLPAAFKVEFARFDCQRKSECKEVKSCMAEDGKIVATVNNVRGLTFRIKFVNKVRFTAGVVTGTMYTSCGEMIPLKWDFASVDPNADPLGPEPGAPLPSSEPETPTPAPEIPTSEPGTDPLEPEPEPPLPPPFIEPETDPTFPDPLEPTSPADGPSSDQAPLPPPEATNPVEGEDDFFTDEELSPAEGPVPVPEAKTAASGAEEMGP
jgi:hypothetical protein